MTDGMKSGSGSDPFAADATEEKELSEESGKTDGTAESSSQSNPTNTEQSGQELPYIFDRSSVKYDRKMVQYFLREKTQKTEKDALRAVEQELGTDVSLIDLRESLVRVGAEHLDEVADELRDWGYRLEEE
jgi:hypothetical protein